MRLRNPIIAATLIVPALLMSACATQEMEKSAKSEAMEQGDSLAAMAKDSMSEHLSALYEVHMDGRIYLFYDRELYKSFLEHGHTAYSFTQIGEGPNGETLVFALTGEDKAKMSGIPSVELFKMETEPKYFYGEMFLDGRIYVFSSMAEMASVRQHHEAAYRLTDIGAGPNGETVVYVLTSENKSERPEELMKMFKSMM